MEEQTQLIVAAILTIASLGAVKDALPSEVVRRYREVLNALQVQFGAKSTPKE
jgi:hypothetical protein